MKTTNELETLATATRTFLATIDPTNPKHRDFVGRCLLMMRANQTSDERTQETTKYHNNKGFTPAGARFGTSVANWFEQKGDISPKQTFRAAKMLEKHSMQLAKTKLGIIV